MLEVFFGSDTEATRTHAHARIKEHVEKGRTLLSLPDGYLPGQLRELAEAESLFGGSHVILIDTPSRNVEMFDEVRELTPLLAESTHLFVIIEEKLLAADKKLFSTYADTHSEFTNGKEESFSAFALADALLRKDKKALWTLLQKSKETSSFEEIVGMFLWQLKCIRLAKRTQSGEEAGLKPYVFKKAQSSAFTNDEADQLSRELLAMYHDVHLGKRDGEIALEKFALNLKI